MTRSMPPEQFLERLHEAGATAILRAGNAGVVAPAMEAAVAAGFSIIEFTMTTPGALDQIEAFSARDGLIVGAGTVLDAETARSAVAAGASFLVSPVVDETVIEEAHRLGVAAMPGTHTPTEMFRAHRAGAQLQKLFPAPGTGPKFVKSVLGPMPFLRIVPTNGVHENNAAAYRKAGAFAVGFVASLFAAGDMAEGRYDRIETRGRRLLATLAAPARVG